MRVVGFSVLHLRFVIRLSVFNFQLLAVGIKSLDLSVLPFSLGLLELKPSYSFYLTFLSLPCFHALLLCVKIGIGRDRLRQRTVDG